MKVAWHDGAPEASPRGNDPQDRSEGQMPDARAASGNQHRFMGNSTCIGSGHGTGSDRTPALLRLSQNGYGGLFVTQAHVRATAVFYLPWFICMGKVPISPPQYAQVPAGPKPGVHLSFNVHWDLGKDS